MYTCIESDWKLYKQKISAWQQNYMKKLRQEYLDLLANPGIGDEEAFWQLEKRIAQDKHSCAVSVEMKRSAMYETIRWLLYYDVISFEDLKDFSTALKDELANFMAFISK
jgi:adenine-specific DNA methylase